MKIALINKFYFPNMIGGSEQVVYQLAKQLKRLGDDVSIYSTSRNRQLEKRFSEEHDIDTHFINSKLGVIDPDLSDYDVIHLHNHFRPMADFLLHKWRKKPIFSTLHGSLWGVYGTRGLKVKGMKLYDKAISVNSLNRYAKKIIAISSEEGKFLSALGIFAKKIVFIPNGIAEDAFLDYRQESLPFDFEPFEYIMTHGRIERRKRLEQTIRILPKIDERIHYVIVGTGDSKYRAELMELAMKFAVFNRVHFVGKVSENVKYALLSHSLAFVLSSRFEGMSISVLEAMAQGTPVIASRTGGTPELIINGHNGLLYDLQNDGELLTCIESITSDPAFRELLGREGKRSAMKYGWGDIAALTRDLYIKNLFTE